ncbi:HAD family hydrolase [Corynebacterium sp. HS2168-gen11]|uniref:HAD family hydrolase n=1 Tax=Corynebacterium sp. HS2168-gen11 TaxID=2974027 RepID=UPI00216AE37A|nr:HAD family hydrolase [Corynebacterium sp. HS2168-gen11]MCS4535960.1 HAD family hydrolase [Corynebacterium sp. HS2168-gen11]
MKPKLIVSDIDGTFLTSAERVTPRLRKIVHRASKSATFVLATGRPARWVFPVLEQLQIHPLCVCSNGAIIYDSAADKILVNHSLQPDIMREIVAKVRAQIPVTLAAERAGQRAEDKRDCFVTAYDFEHVWDSTEHIEQTDAELVSEPAVKLFLRNDRYTSAQLYDQISAILPPSLGQLTYSLGEGILEVSASGVTKASGLAEVSKILGIPARDAIAFGDMRNDQEMLQWAGHGVAMGNAQQALKDIADEVTTSLDDDGVARVLERLF